MSSGKPPPAPASSFRTGDGSVVDLHDPRTRIPASARVLFDEWMRDPHICPAPDGHYYLTGTTREPGSPDGKAGLWNDGIRVWRSPDLKSWEPLGLVWSLDRDATWHRFFHVHEGSRVRFVEPAAFREALPGPDAVVRRSVWAPEIHWVRGLETFVIVASMNYGMGLPYDREKSPYLFGGCFALRSTTGRAEGPYVPTSPGPLCDIIDPCLFEDDDGRLYLLGLNDHLMELKPDLSGLIDPPALHEAEIGPGQRAAYASLWQVPKLEQTRFSPEMKCEGGYLFKHKGRYHLILTASPSLPSDGQPATYAWQGMFAAHNRGPYNAVVASAADVTGPYGPRYTALTHGGHGNFFRDHEGFWWACVFNPPEKSGGPYCELPHCRPALVPMRWDGDWILPHDAEETA